MADFEAQTGILDKLITWIPNDEMASVLSIILISLRFITTAIMQMKGGKNCDEEPRHDFIKHGMFYGGIFYWSFGSKFQ